MNATGDFGQNASTAVEITRLIKDGGPLTKKLHLAADGSVANDSSQCRMSRGKIERMRLDDWRAFGPLIEKTPYNVAWALGSLRDGLPDEARLATKDDPRATQPGFVTRTAENFTYRGGRPGLILHDYDVKGMPAAVKARIEAQGGFIGALAAVCPGLAAAGYIRRRSTSANVVNGETGETYPSSGEHVYLLVQDGSDARRVLYALHDRAWLCGLGWHLVGKAGQLLERSIIDRMVCAPERLVFEAAPDLDQPLRQEPRLAAVHDGPPLDTRAACPDLTPLEMIELDRLKAAAADALKPEAEAAKTAFMAERAAMLVEQGMSPESARATAEAWGKGVLRPGALLDFDDTEIGRQPVAAVLADLSKFDGETLADPIDGVAYGRNCAIVQGSSIFSFAHGGARYQLMHDAASIEAAIMAAPETAAPAVLSKLIIKADVALDEKKRLSKLAGARAGVGSRVAEKMVAEALTAQQEAEAKERRRLSALKSTKARLPVPPADAEAAPVMREWDDILAVAVGPEPPMRDVEGWPVTVLRRGIAGLHELTAASANDDDEEKTRLPSPEEYLLTKHDHYSLEIELSTHMTFIEETKTGDRAVGAPYRLLAHYLRYKQSRLPAARAVVTMPFVLPNGEVLMGEGLDRDHGIVFRIDPALLKYIPERAACTPLAVAKAYKFITDEWLVDVAADSEGKAVLIALALSIIERVLFPNRPTFYVTAGLRGNGKTTALSMLSLAVLGIKPAAMAWTNDAEERKKALYAVLREAAPLLVFDNIPRGTVIGCPHIERASTAELYKDRVLGESESPTAPAYTIIAFTGNNIRPKSDTASRTLSVRLSAERTDPENRAFTHDDPVAWTLDHRGEILHALYTVLLGNPRFGDRDRCASKTRFKAWWHLIGSAIEAAADAALKAEEPRPSFSTMFECVEAEDEDAISRSAILKTLHSIWPKDAAFTTAAVAEHLSAIAARVRDGADEDPHMAELRRFCTAPKAASPSPKAITRALKSIEGAPTAVDDAVMKLHAGWDHNKAATFKVTVVPA